MSGVECGVACQCVCGMIYIKVCNEVGVACIM